MTGRDVTERALPDGYRYAWKFCLLPTLHRGRTIWLRSIPILQRRVLSTAMGISWGDYWVTVGLLDEDPAAKPAPLLGF